MHYDDYRAHCTALNIKPLSRISFHNSDILRIDALVVVEVLHWKDETISLDGYYFRGCRFDNCKLTFKTTSYKLERCHIGSNCIIEAAT